jgi:hypothetical protein
MGLFLLDVWPALCGLRRGFLTLLLASLISLEIPEVSVVRAQEVPGLYADRQGSAGNSAWVSLLTNPFAALFALQQDVFTSGRPQGFSFMAEGLYMNLRGNSQVFSQDVSITTYLGGTTSIVPGNFQTAKPDRVAGLKVGLGYNLEGWDARVLYSRYRAQPHSEQAPPRQVVVTTYLGLTIGSTAQSPYAATAPIVALNNYQADVGFNANLFDFQAGYSIRLGQSSTARLFGGVSYVETKNTLQGTGAVAAGGVMSVDREAVYRAWGPKIGLDLNCHIGGSGLGLRGSGAVGGLFGTQNLASNNTFGAFADSNRQNVTSLEGEAGIGYSFPGMDLTLGYRVERYNVNNLSYVDVGAGLISGSPVRAGNTSAVQYLEGGFLRFEMKL